MIAGKVIYVDVDGTICTIVSNADYEKTLPIQANIDAINRLYDNGNRIIYWTARGTATKIDWRDITEKQLQKWGVKYHELILGKPNYDLWIDDKCINTKNIQEEISYE